MMPKLLGMGEAASSRSPYAFGPHRSLRAFGRGSPLPVVVDEVGVTFSATGDGDGARLVPWESITAVVLFEVPRTDTTEDRWQPAVGVRLVGHPDGVSVHRPLAGWSLDRAGLERIVARFGDGVQVVDGDRAVAAPTAEQLQDEMHRRATEAIRESIRDADRSTPDGMPEWTSDGPATPGGRSDGGPPTGGGPGGTVGTGFVRPGTARYRPVDPAAYLGRFDLRSNLGIVLALLGLQVFLWGVVVPQGGAVGVVFAVIFALPLLPIWRSLRSGGAVALAVDRPGVFFGESRSSGDDQQHRLVPWADVSAVVVYDQLVEGSEQNRWERAVGVRVRGEPTLVRYSRIVESWRLDRPALEAAVACFAPGVRVLDGPPQRPLSTAVTMQALLDTARELYRENDPRRDDG